METELEKLEVVSERSQAIGEFLEWLFGTKKYRIARYLTKVEKERGEILEEIRGNKK